MDLIETVTTKYSIDGYVASYLTKELLKKCIVSLRDGIKSINHTNEFVHLKRVKEEDSINFIKTHLKESTSWASQVSFRDMNDSKDLNDIFVDLDFYFTPLRQRLSETENSKKISLINLLSQRNNIVIVGQPGAGKTTTIKKIFIDSILRINEEFKYTFPLLIRLRELKRKKKTDTHVLLQEILAKVGVFITLKKKTGLKFNMYRSLYSEFIDSLNPLIILDGYDEIEDELLRDDIDSTLRYLALSLEKSNFILTSRSADYNLHINKTSVYEICPLTESQIINFASKWINNEESSSNLITQLKGSPYWDTTMRPLTISHLCAIYERNNSIPERPKSVYKKLIFLLLEDWSNQRSIKRISKYSNFEVERKMEFLSALAYILTVEYGRTTFDESVLRKIYQMLCLNFDLPENEGSHVIQEIESHNGLILQTSIESYEFAHKSLQEYLVAEYISRLALPNYNIPTIIKIPNEMAISIALSSNPNFLIFNLFVNTLKDKALNRNFLIPFLNRLLIEKPDFSSNPLLSITFAYLIHRYTMKSSKDKNGSLFRDDEHLLKQIIFEFMEREVCKKSLVTLELYYEIGLVKFEDDSPLKKIAPDGVAYYLKKNDVDFFEYNVKIDLPNYVVVGDDLYNYKFLTKNDDH